MLNASVIVTDDDARLMYMKNNMKAQVNHVFYNAATFADEVAEPTDAEIQAYYQEHLDDYNVDEKRVLDYVLLELKATPSDSLDVRNQARELVEQARGGDDFAQLAQLYSEDPGSAEQGGDLGFFTRDAMVKPFSDAAFAADVGDVVGPVESNYGLHVIKVTDRRVNDAGETEVKAGHILLKFDASPSTRDAMMEQANFIAAEAMELEDASLQDIAQDEELDVKTTQPFTREGFIPGIGMEPSVSRFAFRSKVGDISNVLTTQNGYLVAQLKEIQEEQTQPLEDVRARVVSAIKAEKRLQVAKEKAQAAYERLEQGMPIDDVAARDTLEVKQTDPFTLGGAIPGVGNEPRFAGTAFALDIGEYSEPIEGTRGYYLLQVIDKTDFNQDAFQAQKESLKRQLTAQRRQEVFATWYEDLKEKADIEDMRALVLR